MSMSPAILIALTLLTSTLATTAFHPLPQIASEGQLADLILSQLGYNSPSVSPKVKQYISDNKISVMTAVDEVVLLVVSSFAHDQPAFQITNKFVNTLGNNLQQLNIKMLLGQNKQQINSYIEQNLQGKSIHFLAVPEGQEQKTTKILMAPKRRVLDSTTTTTTDLSASYITKFFFIIMFLLVTFGALAGIANMENKKDTLLYAKFIADVGR